MPQFLRIAAAGLTAAGALGATLPVAEAQPAPSQTNTCFQASQIENTRVVGAHTLYIRTSARTFYRMDFANDCDSESNGPLIVHPVDNSGQICSAIGVDISVRETGQRCIATGLARLSPDEVAAIPKKDLP
jgi:hypothetical protein